MRTIDPILADALANQKGELILRVNTWTDKDAYDAAPDEPEHTWVVKAFDIQSTSASATLVTENDYTASNFSVFIIERGVKIDGTEYTVQSGLMFVRGYEEDYGAIKITGSSYPKLKISIAAGDGTYQEVIEAFCTEIGKTAVFKNATDAWLGYQFLPDGKGLSLNKAELIESILKQKYTILVYEESPCNLVFYNQDSYPSSALNAIAENDGELLAVATAGANGAMSSDNATDWIPQTIPSFYNATAYSPSLGLWVAVGADVCATSPDRETWTARTIPAGTYNAVVWSVELALFCAVGTDICATTPDGITWTSRTIPAGDWQSVDWSSSLTLFTAVSDKIATSTNGTTWVYQDLKINSWTARTAAQQNEWLDICWSPELELFCAVSGDGTHRVQTSPDGINWTQRSVPNYGGNQLIWTGICWSPELGIFCAVSSNTSGVCMTSPDGITWTTHAIDATGTLHEVCWSPELELFCAVSTYGILTSPDGTTWTRRHSTYAFLAVCWSPELELFCATYDRVYTSPDGINWTERINYSGLGYFTDICWSPELGIFCACGGITDFSTSSDGITWNDVNTDRNWASVCWSQEAHLFVAVGYDSTYKIAYSKDGTNWTRQSGISGTFSAVCWSPELELFCAINTNATYRVLTTTLENKALIKIKWSSSLTLFIGVGISKCYTSPNGTAWTSRTIPAGTYYGLCWSDDLTLLVAVGTNICATSPNGTTWTSRTPASLLNWKDVVWSETLALFIAVSSNGEANVMTSPNGIAWTLIAVSANLSLTYEDGTASHIVRDQSKVHYIWRDEESTVHTDGDTTDPQWNLGFLHSTASPPTTREDAYYKIYLKKAPVRLDITDSDKIHFSPYWSIDPTKTIDAMMQVSEHLDLTKAPAWYQEIKSIILFNSTEGGSLPSTIERVAAYTPLVSTGFDGNLTPAVNNLQALAQAVDDLDISGGGVTDGDKGDITVSGTGAIWTIDNKAVTLAKQADMATASLVYRKTAGAGAPEINTLATVKADMALKADDMSDIDTATDPPVKNEVLKWNGTNWVPAAYDASFEFSIASFSDGESSPQEIGSGVWKAIGAISFTASYNNGPAAATPYVSKSGWSNLNMTGAGYGGPTTNGEAVNYPSVGASITFTLNATDGEDADTATQSVAFYNRRFWGVSSVTGSYSEANVEGLANNELSNSKAKTFTVTPGAGEYIIFAYPSRLGTATFTVGGFEGGFEAPETVSITNASGYTEDYYVYRSTNPNLGSTTVVTS